jgi:hypothetical protein
VEAAASLPDFPRRATLSLSRAGGWKKDLAAGAAFSVIAFLFAFSWGWDLADDSWFLQLANRLVSGDALYRQVYLHVTPLSVYLLALPTAVFGPEMLALRIEVALVFGAVVVVTCRINEQLGATRRYSPLLVIALFAFASPARMALISFYSHVTNCFLIAAFSTWLSFRASGNKRYLYVTGVLLGACFAAKQNTGGFGVAALIVAEIARGLVDKEGLASAIRNLSRAAAAFLVVVVIGLLPIVLTGSLADFIDQDFTGQDTYFKYGGLWFLKPIYSLREVAAHPLSLDALRFINGALPFLLPFALVPLFLMVFAHEDARRRALLVAIVAFSAAAFAIVYPRSDPHHMIFAMPMLIIALAYSWRRLAPLYPPKATKLVRITGFTVSGGILALMTTSAIQRIQPSVGVMSQIPHFRGLILPRYLHVPLSGNVSRLGEFPRDGKTFLLGAHASMYYIAGAMKNPTRYDYPTIVSLRPSGIKEVEEMISDGRIQRVCFTAGDDPILELVELKRWIRKNMIRLPSPDFCEHYTRRTDAGAYQ